MKRMSLARFGRLVGGVMESLPDPFHKYLENLVVDVEREPSDDDLRAVGMSEDEIAAGETIYGVFIPTPLPGEADLGGVDDEDPPMNRIVIYKRPLEDDFPDPGELRIEIRKTVIHELAHHFGLTDRDLERFDNDPDPFGDGD